MQQTYIQTLVPHMFPREPLAVAPKYKRIEYLGHLNFFSTSFTIAWGVLRIEATVEKGLIF